jgi:hypothetical protein
LNSADAQIFIAEFGKAFPEYRDFSKTENLIFGFRKAVMLIRLQANFSQPAVGGRAAVKIYVLLPLSNSSSSSRGTHL